MSAMIPPNQFAKVGGLLSCLGLWCQFAMKAAGASPVAAKGGGMALPMSSHASSIFSGRMVVLVKPCATRSSLGK
eukprot:7310582-Heterocapsa_arctica.AAC.1